MADPTTPKSDSGVPVTGPMTTQQRAWDKNGDAGGGSGRPKQTPPAPPVVTVSGLLRRWAEEGSLQAKPAFVFFHPTGAGAPLTLSRREVYTLAKRFAFRLVSKVLELRGLSKTYVINTLPPSPERVIIDLGTLLAGGIVVDGPRDHKGWKTFDSNFQDLGGSKVIILAADSELDHFLTSTAQSTKLVQQAVIDRVVPAGSAEAKEDPGILELLKELKDMDPVKEFQLEKAHDDKLMVVWRSPAFNDENAQELIGYQRQGLVELTRHMHELLQFDRSRQTLINPCNPAVPWGFPLAYLYHGVTTVCANHLLPRAVTDESGTTGISYIPAHEVESFNWDSVRQEGAQRSLIAWFDKEAVDELKRRRTFDSFSSRVQMGLAPMTGVQFSTLVLCGVAATADLVKQYWNVAAKIVVTYSSVQMGVISKHTPPRGADFDISNTGNVLKGVQVRVTDTKNDSKYLTADPRRKPGALYVQNECMGPRRKLVGGSGGRWQVVTEEDWWPTQDLAFLDDRDCLHIVGRTVWHLTIENEGRAPVAVIEKNCAQDRDFKEVVFVQVVPDPNAALANNPLTNGFQLLACVILHSNALNRSMGHLQQRIMDVQNGQRLDSSSQAGYIVVFDRLPQTHHLSSQRSQGADSPREPSRSPETAGPADAPAQEAPRVLNRPRIAHEARKVYSAGKHRVSEMSRAPSMRALQTPPRAAFRRLGHLVRRNTLGSP